MRIVSFNVNGIRARTHQLQALVERCQPDIIGLQETKVEDPSFPRDVPEALGMQAAWHGQKGHYGVALLTRQTPTAMQLGWPHGDDHQQRRFMAGTLDTASGPLHVINGYFPQGENRSHPDKFPCKERYYADLLAYLQAHFTPADQVVVMGDMNVAPTDLDVGIGEDNRKRWLRSGKCCFLPEERDWLNALLNWGLTDTFRHQHPTVDDRFSWFDYRSRGFEREPPRGLRIDLILATPPLVRALSDAGIDYTTRAMERPSDHCPVWADFDL